MLFKNGEDVFISDIVYRELPRAWMAPPAGIISSVAPPRTSKINKGRCFRIVKTLLINRLHNHDPELVRFNPDGTKHGLLG
jgi:hypothetical protein